MKLLADANIAAMIVARLRLLGHDVLYAAELPTQDDASWLALARADRRTLLTDDKDFGELVFRQNLTAGTVVLLRLHTLTPVERADWLEPQWPHILSQPEGSFVVVTQSKLRIRLRS